MTSEQLNVAIRKLVELREKVYALETGKYGELELSKEQVILLNQQADVIKQSLKDDAAAIAVGVPIEQIKESPAEEIKE